MGRLACGYADEIFSLGQEFLDVLEGRPTGRPVRLEVGITDVTSVASSTGGLTHAHGST